MVSGGSVFLTKLSTIVTPLTRGGAQRGGNDESWPGDFHDSRGSEIPDGNSIIPSGSRYRRVLKNYRPCMFDKTTVVDRLSKDGLRRNTRNLIISSRRDFE